MPPWKPNACVTNKESNMTRIESCQPNGGDKSKGWCFTKSLQNDSGLIGEFGYCDLGCTSENIEQQYYNLASKDHLWEEHIFMLDESSSGHCHTYNPGNKSVARNHGQFYAKLGIYCEAQAKGQAKIDEGRSLKGL